MAATDSEGSAAVPATPVPRRRGAFWTSRQRAAHSLHEISYRACFKPQLPRYFIERYSDPGDVVYDPFSGRGTTPLEAALLGRRVLSNDINPLSRILAEPRFAPPVTEAVAARLQLIPLDRSARAERDLSMFYHPRTEAELVSLRRYFVARRAAGVEDEVDRWIRMVATNRLTGHSAGFFSVYSFPPNQAVSPEAQRRINRNRRQSPEYRDIRELILRKTRSLLRHVTAEDRARLVAAAPSFLERDARDTPGLADATVQLVVTSPPFLDVVQYATDNWLRCWFNSLPLERITRSVTITSSLEEWEAAMGQVLRELHRVTRTGGWVAFEVGEIRRGRVRLEDHVAPLGQAAGFTCERILIHQQRFTKTAHIWGVANNRAGTNSHRIVLFRR